MFLQRTANWLKDKSQRLVVKKTTLNRGVPHKLMLNTFPLRIFTHVLEDEIDSKVSIFADDLKFRMMVGRDIVVRPKSLICTIPLVVINYTVHKKL